MKYISKQELIDDIEGEFSRLLAVLDVVPEHRYRDAGVWGEEWTINDLVAHLTEWHRLFLGWHRAGLRGESPQMPAPGYGWNETPRLNRAIWRKHKGRPTGELWEELQSSHAEVLGLAQSLSPEQLLSPGQFAWTGRNALVTYLGANTASHYRFAIRVLKRWRRSEGRRADAREPK